MATPDEINRKVEDLAMRIDVVHRKKAELLAALQAKKADLASLVQEINGPADEHQARLSWGRSNPARVASADRGSQ
jgi:hypothetical protein